MKKQFILATALLGMTVFAKAQNVVTNANPVRVSYTPWYSGIPGGMRVATSEGIEYNTSTKKWVYNNNPVTRYFSSTFIGEGELNFLSSVQGTTTTGNDMVTKINTGDNATMLSNFTRFRVDANGNGSFGGNEIRLGCNANYAYSPINSSFITTGKTALNSYKSTNTGLTYLMVNPANNFDGTVFVKKVSIGGNMNYWDARFATDAALTVQGKIFCEGFQHNKFRINLLFQLCSRCYFGFEKYPNHRKRRVPTVFCTNERLCLHKKSRW